jgi:hypothetical protein
VTRVVRGQLWSLMDSMRPRYTLRITRVTIKRAFGILEGGKEGSVNIGVLQQGRRGARLIEHPDGTLAEPCERQRRERATFRVPDVETKTASDFVKKTEPRGVVRTGDLQREALALRESGVSVDVLCAKYGKTRGTVNAWVCRAREEREDERNRAALRRAG